MSQQIIQRNGNTTIDTTFVLFFLAVVLGSGGGLIETALTAVTLAAMIILPYFLASEDVGKFSTWVIARSLLAAAGVVIGVLFSFAAGSVLPASAKYLPMTFLILSAVISCYMQIFGVMKLRLAK